MAEDTLQLFTITGKMFPKNLFIINVVASGQALLQTCNVDFSGFHATLT